MKCKSFIRARFWALALTSSVAGLSASAVLAGPAPVIPKTKPSKIPAIPYKLSVGTPLFLVTSGGVERKASVGLDGVHSVPLEGGLVQMRKDGAVQLLLARIAQGTALHRVSCYVDQADAMQFTQRHESNGAVIKQQVVKLSSDGFVQFDVAFPQSGQTIISLQKFAPKDLPGDVFGWGYCTVAKAPL